MKVNMNGSLSRAARMLLGFAALGAAIPAFAAGNVINLGSSNVWTVYAFGNAQAVADAFRALTNFAASPLFQSLVSMIAVLGVLGVGAAGGFNPAMARRLIGYFVSVFLVCYFLFGVTNGGPLLVNVEVVDSVDMTWKAPVTVPAVVGIPASIISTAGYKLTQSIEASFALPTDLKMSNGAPFNLAASMIADASQARITDPNLASSLSYYVQDCFTIGVARGALQASTLIHSTDFLNDIKFNSDAIMVNTMLQPPVGSPGVVTCNEAWKLISDAITAQGSTASDFLKDASAWTKTPAMSVVNSAADSTAQWASNNGITDGAALVKQSAVLSAFRGAYSQAANQTGNSEFLTGIAMTQATEAQRTSWITGAEVFNKTMGYIFAIIQVFVYAITPLVLCAALVPNLGFALLKNFSQILLWLAIWQPMLSIVNFIVISMQQAELGGVLSTGAKYGFTLSNIGIVSEKTANLRAAASFVGTMVPALAWAMVKGSVDFSRVIGSAVGENFAQGAANTMTTGNYSLNQASMDSFTANKHSTAATGAWGNGISTNGAVGSHDNNLGGSNTGRVGEQNAMINTSANQGTTNGGNAGDQTGVAHTGSAVTSASNGTNMNTTAGGQVATSSGESSTAGTNLGFTAGGQGNVSLIQPNNRRNPDGSAANAAGGGNAVGQGGANGAGTPPSTPANTDPKKGLAATLMAPIAAAMDRVGLQASMGVQGGASGAHQRAHQLNDSHNRGQNGGTTASGSQTLSDGTSGNDGRTAGNQHGYQHGTSENVTGIAPTLARAQLAAQVLRQDNFMTTGEFEMPHVTKSDVSDKSEKLNTYGAVRQAVGAEETAVAKEQGALKGEVKHLHDNAEAQKKRNDGAAMKVYNGEVAATNAGIPAAKVEASTRAVESLKGAGASLVKDGMELYERGLKAVGVGLGGHEPSSGANPSGQPTTMPAVTPAAAATAVTSQLQQQTGHKDDHGSKPQDTQHAKQPEGQGTKPQDTQHAKQPEGQGAKPQDTQHAKQPDGQGAKPQDTQHAKQPDGQGAKPQDTQHAKQPDGQGAKPQDTQHAKQPDGQGTKPQDAQHAKQQDGQGTKPQDAQHAKQQDGQGHKPQDTQHAKQPDGQGTKPQVTQHAKQPDGQGTKPQDTQHAKQPDGQGHKPQDAQHAKQQDGQGNKPQGTQPAKQQDGQGNKPQDTQHAKQQDGQGAKPQDTQHAKPQDTQHAKPQDTQHAKQQDGQGTKPQGTQYAKQQDGQGTKSQGTQYAKQQDGQGLKPQDPQHAKQQDGQGHKPQDTQHAKQQDGQGTKPQDTQHAKQQDGHGNKPPVNPTARPGNQVDGQPVAARNDQPPGQHPQAGTPNRAEGTPDKAQQLASQSGKDHDRDAQKQDDRALAQNDQQRQQEQRERELKERQLAAAAAAAAVGQALQTAQAAPQQQQQLQQPTGAVPEGVPPAAGEQQRQQLAMGDSPAPNPFSGEKAVTSEGQLQGQVQLAEQRAERMSSQLRGIEGALASADGRKPSELPDLINQARDLVRNA